MKTKALLVALIISIICCFSSCNNNEVENKSSVIVVMNPNSEPQGGFNPAYGWGAGEHVHEPLIQSTLTVTTKDLKIENDLATEIKVSEDGMTWEVKIREDVNFTNGEKLTAHDVAFTYNTVKSVSSVNDFTMLNSATAVDDTMVKFSMNKPYSIWPYTMAIVGIMPKNSYDQNYGENPIGSGRYKLKQWDKGQQVILEANENYYGEKPKIKNVTVLFMSEETALSAVMAHKVDLSYTAATYSNEKIDGFNLLSYETVDNRGINLPSIKNQGNIGNNVTSDIAIRRAINIGVNRQEIINNVLNGHGTPAYSVCDKMPWFNKDSIVEEDFNKAIKILEDAGWILKENNIRVKDNIEAKFELLYPTGDSVRQAISSDLSNQLKKLGIDAAVSGVSWDEAYDKAQSQPLMWGWGAHTPMELYNIYHTDDKNNLAKYSPYSNLGVDNYMDMALKSSSLDQAYSLWQKAQWDGKDGILADIPWVWLVNINHLYFAKDGLQVANQKIHPHGHGWSIVNNVDKWEWK